MINPPANPKATVSKGPTWPEVVAMYRELGLLVCDDEEAIRDEFEKRRPGYVRDAASPQQDISSRARKNMQNGQALITANSRARHIKVVYDGFSAGADTSLQVLLETDQTSVSPAFRESLVQLAGKAYSTRRDLAERFADDWLEAKKLKIGSDIRPEPPQITDFIAAGGVGEIRLSWNRPGQFCERVVLTRQGESKSIFSGLDDHYVDRLALPGVAYVYEIHAEYKKKQGPTSPSRPAVALAEVLEPVAKLLNGFVQLAWKSPFKNASVRIFRRLNQAPSIKRGGGGPEPADSNTQQVWSGSGTEFSEPGIEGATVYYLITVDDKRGNYTPGASLFISVPKPPPAPRNATIRYRFDSGRDVVELDWQPDNPSSRYFYIVVRREGTIAPKSPADGLASPATRNLNWEDNLGGLVPGKCYSYAVFSLDDKTYSRTGCAAAPVRILSEVTQCSFHAGGASLELVWQPPSNVSQVRVRRLPLPGIELPVSGKAKATDKSVCPGITYRYIIDCFYGNEGGRELRSPGIEVTAEAGGPPDPVKDFRVFGKASQIHCSWAKPARGGIRAWKARKAPSIAEAASFITLQRDRMLNDCEARPLQPGHDAAVDTSPDDEHPYYFALAEHGSHCVMGPVRRAGVCLPVSGLEVLETDSNRVILTWIWPEAIKTAAILYRPDTWPTGPEDPLAAKRIVNEVEFSRQGSRIELSVPGMKTAYFVVVPCRHSDNDELVYGSTDEPACRAGPLSLGPPPVLSYTISHHWMRKPTVEIEMHNGWTDFSGMVLVASSTPPDSIMDGVRVLEPTLPAAGRVSETIPLAILKQYGWPKCHLRLFLRDNSQNAFVEIVHPKMNTIEL